MSISNTAIIGHLARVNTFAFDDDVTAGPALTQATAIPVKSRVTRITSAVANGSMILKDILTNDAPNLCFVVNDSAQTIQVYPFAGQNVNGSLNVPFAIVSGSFGLFSRMQATQDWRAAVIT